MVKFKDRLKQLRTDEGLSQRALADLLNISSSAIGMYEAGQRQPDFETLEAIADHFNVDMDFLVGRKDTTMRYVSVDPVREAEGRNIAAHLEAEGYSEAEIKDIKGYLSLVKARRND